MTDQPKKGLPIAARRTKMELHRSAVHGWQKGPSKDIAKELIYLLQTTLDDLQATQREVVNVRNTLMRISRGGTDGTAPTPKQK